MLKKYIECGKIVGTHGVHGEVRVQPWCDEIEFLNYYTVRQIVEFMDVVLDETSIY